MAPVVHKEEEDRRKGKDLLMIPNTNSSTLQDKDKVLSKRNIIESNRVIEVNRV